MPYLWTSRNSNFLELRGVDEAISSSYLLHIRRQKGRSGSAVFPSNNPEPLHKSSPENKYLCLLHQPARQRSFYNCKINNDEDPVLSVLVSSKPDRALHSIQEQLVTYGRAKRGCSKTSNALKETKKRNFLRFDIFLKMGWIILDLKHAETPNPNFKRCHNRFLNGPVKFYMYLQCLFCESRKDRIHAKITALVWLIEIDRSPRRSLRDGHFER